MTSLSTGASRRVSARSRLSTARRPSAGPAEFGQPGARWRSAGNPLGRALLRLLFAAAGTLMAWQQRLEDRAYLERMPDYLLHDIGLNDADVHREIAKPFWRP